MSDGPGVRINVDPSAQGTADSVDSHDPTADLVLGPLSSRLVLSNSSAIGANPNVLNGDLAPGSGNAYDLGNRSTLQAWRVVRYGTRKRRQVASLSYTPPSISFGTSNGSVIRVVLTANITSWSLPSASPDADELHILWEQDGTGGRTVTGGPGNGSLPAWTMSPGIGKRDLLIFTFVDTLGLWIGQIGAQNL